MMAPDGSFPNCLKPHIRAEAISLKDAMQIAGRSESTIRNWCNRFGVGRRIAGGKFDISRVALAMHMDSDTDALKAYLSGDRQSEAVRSYYDRYGILISPNYAKSTIPANRARYA